MQTFGDLCAVGFLHKSLYCSGMAKIGMGPLLSSNIYYVRVVHYNNFCHEVEAGNTVTFSRVVSRIAHGDSTYSLY